MKMELNWVWTSGAILVACYILVYKIVRNINDWYYGLKLRGKGYPLPPGHMGWPFIGNLFNFVIDFSSGRPDSFIHNLVSKYGKGGIYKSHLFGNPTIIVCDAEMCKQVLTNDTNFKLGYPKSITKLAKSRSTWDVSTPDKRHFRQTITAPIVGHNVLAMYIERIEDIVVNSLEELSSMQHPLEMLKEMKKVTFKVIIHIFMGSKNQLNFAEIADLFGKMFSAAYSLPINAPGFTFHQALKAREKLVKIIQPVVKERRLKMEKGEVEEKKDLVDILLQIKEENGHKWEDEDITDTLIGLLFAGHDSSATAITWTITNLAQNSHIMEKVKEEQHEIMNTRPHHQKRLNMTEFKRMVYLSQVFNETLRQANIAFAIFREVTADVNINGYIIPKGWKVLSWTRAVHMNPQLYPNPEEFDPSRWEDYNPKPGTFLPFGAGSRLCPGANLAKLVNFIIIHYFVRDYKLELVNPNCPITSLPMTKPKDNFLGKVIKVSNT